MHRAHGATTGFLTGNGHDDHTGASVADTVVLVVSELLANAVTHGSATGAGTPRPLHTDTPPPATQDGGDGNGDGEDDLVQLRLRRGPRTLVIEVCDSHPALRPTAGLWSRAQTTGAACIFFHALAHGSGHRPTPTAKPSGAEVTPPG